VDGLELKPAKPATAAALRVGLTGGIGSGKSTVAAELVRCGAVLVDTDAIARALTVPGGAAIGALRTAFGPEAITPDGALDRNRMRALAFADAGAKQQLEAILHPLIGEEARRQALAAGDAPVVFDVPLLTESSVWRARVHRVLVVDCSTHTQVQRVAQRPGWSEAAARSVIAQQAGRERRRAMADAVIHNEGITLAALALQVSRLWSLWNNAAHQAVSFTAAP
jgi:dephospho-CoA kinase